MRFAEGIRARLAPPIRRMQISGRKGGAWFRRRGRPTGGDLRHPFPGAMAQMIRPLT